MSTNSSPTKKKQRLNDVSFSTIKSRYLNSVQEFTPLSTPSKSASKPASNSGSMNFARSPQKSPSKGHSDASCGAVSLQGDDDAAATAASAADTTTDSKKDDSKKLEKFGKFGVMTDLEINTQIQTIMNQEIILKNLLLSVVSSLKTSRSELQELNENTSSNNAQVASLIKNFEKYQDTVNESTHNLQEFYTKINKTLSDTGSNSGSAKKIESTLEQFMDDFDELKPRLEKICKEGGFNESKQTAMTYNIVKSNRAEALAILEKLNHWNEQQEVFLHKIESKLSQRDQVKTDKAQDLLLLSNISQLLEENFHKTGFRNKQTVQDLLKSFTSSLETKIASEMGKRDSKLYDGMNDVLAGLEKVQARMGTEKALQRQFESQNEVISGNMDIIAQNLKEVESSNRDSTYKILQTIKHEISAAMKDQNSVESKKIAYELKELTQNLHRSDSASSASLKKQASGIDEKVMKKLVKATESKQEETLEKFKEELKQEMKQSLAEKLVSDSDKQLLDERLSRWSTQVDKNISALLVSTLNSKFQNSLKDSVKETLSETLAQTSQKTQTREDSDSLRLLEKELENVRLSNQVKDAEIARLQQKVADFEKTEAIEKRSERLHKSVARLEVQRSKMKSELRSLSEAYEYRYQEFNHLQKRYNELLGNFNNLLVDKFKNIFGASAMAMLNKTTETPSPKKSVNVLSPIKNNSSVKFAATPKTKRNYSLNIRDTPGGAVHNKEN